MGGREVARGAEAGEHGLAVGGGGEGLGHVAGIGEGFGEDEGFQEGGLGAGT